VNLFVAFVLVDCPNGIDVSVLKVEGFVFECGWVRWARFVLVCLGICFFVFVLLLFAGGGGAGGCMFQMSMVLDFVCMVLSPLRCIVFLSFDIFEILEVNMFSSFGCGCDMDG